MERIFDQASVIKLLKDGIKKGYWTLEDLDKPSPGWTECVNNTKGNGVFPSEYKGVKFRNLARVETPKPKPKPPEEKVELTNPKDFSQYDF
tara:strand:+ start:373 stop:645 length:273 start_codon:yes stop_codon:yes gene_type:complete